MLYKIITLKSFESTTGRSCGQNDRDGSFERNQRIQRRI